MLDLPHEMISNFNLGSMTVKVYTKKTPTADDPSGMGVYFDNINNIVKGFTNPGPQDIPKIVNELYEVDDITRVEILNPMNNNGLVVYMDPAYKL